MELASFGTVTGCPIHLTPASFNPQLIKAEILQYCKGLTGAVKSNHVLVEQSFHSVPSGNEDLKHHTLVVTWRFHLLEKTPSELSSISLERPLSNTANQPLCHQTPRNRLLDSCDTPEESENSDWNCVSSGDLKAKIFQN